MVQEEKQFHVYLIKLNLNISSHALSGAPRTFPHFQDPTIISTTMLKLAGHMETAGSVVKACFIIKMVLPVVKISISKMRVMKPSYIYKGNNFNAKTALLRCSSNACMFPLFNVHL